MGREGDLAPVPWGAADFLSRVGLVLRYGTRARACIVGVLLAA